MNSNPFKCGYLPPNSVLHTELLEDKPIETFSTISCYKSTDTNTGAAGIDFHEVITFHKHG